MSDPDEEVELQALQRQLDDAFETTRPRPEFGDELWARMQARRPVGTRIRDALGGLVQGIRDVPAVPAAAVAALLVVVIGAGILAYSGLGRGGGATSTSAGSAAAPANADFTAGGFGKLPPPVLPATGRSGVAVPGTGPLAAASPDYAGPVQLTWNGSFNLSVGSAPVFRYQEPTTTTADQFAAALGAVLRSRPGGLLGTYDASDYTLEVRGTVQSPPQSPAYFVYSAPSTPPLEAAGAGPADLAELFLAEHSLTPQWGYDVAVAMSGDLTRVIFERQFVAPGYGPAHLVDAQGDPYGMEVDVTGNRVVHVNGVLPVSLDSATYRIISSDAAVRAAIGTGTAVPLTSTPAPAVQLTQAELAYVLVPAGDHSFYEPVFIFSGTFQLNGATYTKHVLVPAVDPSQRVP